MDAYLFTSTTEREFNIWVPLEEEDGHLRILVPPDMGLSLIVPEDMTPGQLLEELERLVRLIRNTIRFWGAAMN